MHDHDSQLILLNQTKKQNNNNNKQQQQQQQKKHRFGGSNKHNDTRQHILLHLRREKYRNSHSRVTQVVSLTQTPSSATAGTLVATVSRQHHNAARLRSARRLWNYADEHIENEQCRVFDVNNATNKINSCKTVSRPFTTNVVFQQLHTFAIVSSICSVAGIT